MKEDSLISIIVPVYNVEPYLPRCLDSLMNQTHKNLEIIVVNDGSTDNCGQICDEYAKKDSRIVVIHKENGGLSSARNSGLDIAKGEWIGFMDSDDWTEPNMYADFLNACLQNDCSMAFCSRYINFTDGRICYSGKIDSNIYIINSKDYFKRTLEDELGVRVP